MNTGGARLATAADFTVALAPSALAAGLIAACAVLAGLAWPEGAPWWPLAFLPWLGWRLWRDTARLSALEVRAGRRLIVTRGRVRTEVALCDDSLALPGLIVLHYLRGQARERCVLLADSAPRNDLRRLRMFVRWGRGASNLQDFR